MITEREMRQIRQIVREELAAMSQDIPRLLTPEEVSGILGLSVETLANRRYLGKGPEAVKIGGAVLYEPHVIKSFIENSKQG